MMLKVFGTALLLISAIPALAISPGGTANDPISIATNGNALKTSRNEGDTRVPFSVVCSSTAWTQVVPLRATRRSVIMQALITMQQGICISTNTPSSTSPCADATPGVELSTGTAYTDYGTGSLGCRARSGSSGERLKGLESYSSAD